MRTNNHCTECGKNDWAPYGGKCLPCFTRSEHALFEKARAMGQHAYRSDPDNSENPFTLGTRSSEAWADGWLCAERAETESMMDTMHGRPL